MNYFFAYCYVKAYFGTKYFQKPNKHIFFNVLMKKFKLFQTIIKYKLIIKKSN